MGPEKGDDPIPDLADDLLLDTHEVAIQLKVSPSTIERLRKRGALPAVRVSTRAVRFRLRDVWAFLDSLQDAHLSASPQA